MEGGGGNRLSLPGPGLGQETEGEDRDKKKTPSVLSDTFPTDDTPTPTRILRMADMDLFGELKDSGQYSAKENPFDAHFRKAAEAVQQGHNISSSVASVNSPSVSVAVSEIEDTLNTPQIYCGDSLQSGSSTTPTSSLNTTSRPVILKVHPSTSRLPTASVLPVKTYKPIAPSPQGAE